ncbi:MAG: hypothetical protein ACRD8U_11000, partial [Pyrinomonadaceae bacterium]
MFKKKVMLLFLIAIPAALLVVFAPDIKRAAKSRGPLKAMFSKYSKWKYNWRSPSDLGDGKNALQIIIDSPMGLAEDASGNVY